MKTAAIQGISNEEPSCETNSVRIVSKSAQPYSMRQSGRAAAGKRLTKRRWFSAGLDGLN